MDMASIEAGECVRNWLRTVFTDTETSTPRTSYVRAFVHSRYVPGLYELVRWRVDGILLVCGPDSLRSDDLVDHGSGQPSTPYPGDEAAGNSAEGAPFA